ncbi:TetR/AcrR family transcriptional regulator [Agromyces intestinalis]|uniref:TetR/AcrR family transcriptional regulator n=1 Tax=Agromyces intestinalis TaxID=2592652 RepID=A0A5C1YB33_9MICO|nr:TetR-like C-terminal domain-containing protein [Agromyces intestinalis]QEO13323.1 TetR/AcrR family transcriptional regulator [Agromyces intestinalis]
MPTPERTSLDRMVRAGRALVDDGGVDALTMQAVAARVGVRAPSLYKRVRNREHLVGLVVDDVAHELTQRLAAASAAVRGEPEAVEGDPSARLSTLARALREWATANPAAFGLLFIEPERDLGSEAALRDASRAVVDVAEAIVGPDDALPFARTVTAWASGFLAMELGGRFRLGPGVDEAYEYGIGVLARGAVRASELA